MCEKGSEVHMCIRGWCSLVQSLLRCCVIISMHAFLAYLCVERGKWSILCGVEKWIYRQIRNNKQTDVLFVHFPCFLCLYLKPLYSRKNCSFFLSFSPNSYTCPLYLSFYVIGLPLQRLAQFRLTYFFSILTICLTHTNSSAPLSSLCFLTDSPSLMNTIGFFFCSSPSAKMPTIKDPYIN